MKLENLDKIINLCKRRGLIFQSSEPYGGINGFWDFGPFGTSMRRAIENLWWDYMVEQRDNVEGQDSTIICHPRVWDASGHTSQFADFMVDNKINNKRYRLDNLLSQQKDNLLEALSKELNCPNDVEKLEHAITSLEQEKSQKLLNDFKIQDPNNKQADWTAPRQFNLMMQTYVGPVFDEDHKAYLRAETCQPIFVNFPQIQNCARQKLPFGIAQIGKAFRNEINPRNFIFRSREFTQMEMEFFCTEEDALSWYDYWKKERLNFYHNILKFPKEALRIHDHPTEKLAHYAHAALDIEYLFPFGWGELEGVHHRGTWDISRHSEFSKQKMDYYDQEKKELITPTVVETSVGLDRMMLAILCEFYDEEEVKTAKEETDIRTVLRLPAIIAPRQVAILPLSKKLSEKAREVYAVVRKKFRAIYDEAGAIGRRYRRQDEIGTYYCVTIDFDTLEDNQVTLRNRDSMEQTRVSLDNLLSTIEQGIYS